MFKIRNKFIFIDWLKSFNIVEYNVTRKKKIFLINVII